MSACSAPAAGPPLHEACRFGLGTNRSGQSSKVRPWAGMFTGAHSTAVALGLAELLRRGSRCRYEQRIAWGASHGTIPRPRSYFRRRSRTIGAKSKSASLMAAAAPAGPVRTRRHHKSHHWPLSPPYQITSTTYCNRTNNTLARAQANMKVRVLPPHARSS